MIAPQDNSLTGLLSDIAYWASVGVLGVYTFASVVVFAGYAWHTWG